MEFFERAHVVKSKDSKSNKKEENLKKQLKQMLYGYKHSDSKLIQNSADIKSDYNEDSASVSGFSDLNLTDSTCDDGSLGVNSLIEESSVSYQAKHSSMLSSPDSPAKVSVNSLSEPCETIESLLEDLNPDTDHAMSSEESNSLRSGMVESNPDSNNSEPFDANGKLALEIRRQLQKRLHRDVEYDDNSASDTSSCKVMHLEEQDSFDCMSKSDSGSSSDDYIIEYNEQMNPEFPPYVSIIANDMPHRKLDEVIGKYKYSTIRNLSLDNQNTVSTNNSGFFVEETMSVDIHTEEEVGSLIPEFDDVPTVEEIDEELKNLNTALDTEPELDNTVDSEIVNDLDLSIVINVEETFKIYKSNKAYIVVLKHPSELFIHGKVKIKGLGGTVEIFGYTLKDDACDVYAPYYNYALSVKTVENPNAYYGLFGKLTAAGISVTKAEEIVTSVGDQDGIILLESLEKKAIEFVENNFKSNPLFAKTNRLVEPYFKNASEKLNCSLSSIRPLKSLYVHPSWNEAFLHAEYRLSRGIVCGGKGVGKSTYLRYQVNKLLSKGPVLVVDLDPGQCEFTVAGNISATVVTTPLLGPNFTHLKKPDIMLNIAMINTMDNATRYVSAVRSLLTQCHENEAFANMPWVVNTMGMTVALGLKFITIIIILLKPTYLVQYESTNSKKQFETQLKPDNVKHLYESFKRNHLFKNINYLGDLDYSFTVSHDIDDSINHGTSMSARDERYLNFLAYFGSLMNIHKNLLSIVPYEVSLKELYVCTNVIVKSDSLLKVLNGKVVALCQQTCDSAKLFTLDDKPLLCHGHGLIRGIDWEKELLYMISPMQSRDLCNVNVVLYADWVPDLVGQGGELPKGTILPYRIKTHDQTKQLMTTPRRRFNPLQLINMTRSA